jgi:hypothetical protein
MKKVLVFLMVTAFAFTLLNFKPVDKPLVTKGENSCTVTVKYSGGSPAEGIKVTSDVCGGISCGGGRDFYTDKEGKATVKWVEGCKLCYIYVKGTSHKGDYSNGGTYNFTID